MNLCRLGRGKTFRQPRLAIFVHQKTDGAEVHSIDRLLAVQEFVECLKHENIAAECDDDVSILLACIVITLAQSRQRGLGVRCIGSCEMKTWGCHLSAPYQGGGHV